MIQIDGSIGEGGGQVLRSALALSMTTGQGFKMKNIRANRSQPGLRPQHLEAVKAACEISRAQCEGGSIGSTSLEFIPRKIHPGRYRFEIGTAGSTSLVFQTVFLPLSRADVASSISITGGTHVPASPSFHYLDFHWLPFLRRVGFEAAIHLDSAGFYPQGGGKFSGTIRSTKQINPLELVQRGQLKRIRGMSAVANLDRRIAERQRNQVLHQLGDRYPINDLRIAQLPGPSRGTMLLLLVEFEYTQACYFALGELGKPAERVADEAVESFESFIVSDGAIDQYLADQLLLPLSFASGNSIFKTSQVTNHLITNAAIIQKFLEVNLEIEGDIGRPGIIRIIP
jgi:RNA 3'-terminal phosphate cyclase (ATP)